MTVIIYSLAELASGPYGPIAAGLLKTLGVNVPALIKKTQNEKFYETQGLEAGVFFDQETFGADKLVVGIGSAPFAQVLRDAPLSARAREDINATIARVLVRNLLPHAFPGGSVEDIVTARVNYAALDRPENAVRLRLNSIVIRVRQLEASAARGPVEVTYLRGGRPYTARARGAVLAGYNMMIPYLCPELPAPQKDALHKLVKTPLVYTSVALRNWRAFHALKVHHVYAPGSYHMYLHLNAHVDIGAYRSTKSPEQPILLHMVRTPCKAGLPEHEQNRAGRAELLATSFETFERNIRDQLQRILRDGGFDLARDITAITVNRWAHGYAPEYNPLFDPDVPEAQRPHVIGRAPFGRITIANSDSGGAAYTDSAIDQGHRAVMELLHDRPG